VAEIALKWALAGKGITCTLVGVRNAEQLADNIQSAAAALPAELVAELTIATDELLEALGPSFDYYEPPADDRT